MRSKRFPTLFASVFFAGLLILLLLPALASEKFSAYGQGGNTISGHIFGFDRQPLYDANVELLDDLSRIVQRQRTETSGRYFFSGMPSGRYTIRVKPYQTDYEEQDQDVEIQNFTTQGIDGERRTSGFANEQRDFYLRLRRGVTGVTGTVFVQDVPPDARKLYEKAVKDLNDKKQNEGIAGLKAAIEKFPKYFAALERLGSLYAELKYYEASAILLKAATNENPRSSRAWYGLAYSLNGLKQDDEALTAVLKALEIFPDSTDALLLSGVLLRQNKKFDEAEKNLLRAKEVSPVKIPLVHWHLALLYGYDLKRYSEAAKELKTFLKVQPNSKDEEKIKTLIVDFEKKAQEQAQK